MSFGQSDIDRIAEIYAHSIDLHPRLVSTHHPGSAKHHANHSECYEQVTVSHTLSTSLFCSGIQQIY